MAVLDDAEAGEGLTTGTRTTTGASCSRPHVVRDMIFVFFIFAVYVLNSAGLITFNKYLMNKDHFPYPAVLVCWHAFATSFIAGLLFCFKPSLFTSLTDPDPAKRADINWKLITTCALPIGCLFSVSLVLSNTAYMYASMAFLQMIKESNVVMVFVISALAGLEKVSLQKAQVLVLVIVATTMTVHGEMHFSLVALMIQGSSQLFESAKIVIQSIMLSGYKLDTFTYLGVVMPCVFLFLFGLVVVSALVAPTSNFGELPSWALTMHWGPVLVLNALVAFSLNMVSAIFIKRTSAVAITLAGICKDTVIVLVGVVVMHEQVSAMQITGFALQLSSIFLWSMMRMFAKDFENGIVKGVVSLSNQLQDMARKSMSPVKAGRQETEFKVEKTSYGAAVETDRAK